MPRNLHKTLEASAAKYALNRAREREATKATDRNIARRRAYNAAIEHQVAQHKQNLYDSVEAINLASGHTPGRRYRHQVEVSDMHDITKGDFTPYLWAKENLSKPWRVYQLHGSMYFGSTCAREATMFKMFWG